MVAKLYAGQFRKPTGLFGRLIGRLMARGNFFEIAWTISLLNIQADEHVLEVGFGPGISIQMVSKQTTRGRAAGVDFSPTMVQVARKRNAAAIQAGRVDLQQGDVNAVPFGDASFDKAFAIHSIYFWPKPTEGLNELRRVLKPDGLLAVTIRPKEKWKRTPPADVFTLYSDGDIERLLTESRFRQIRVETSPEPDRSTCICVLGVK